MAKWKLSRQISGYEEFTLSEGDKITIGRGTDNTISLSSIVISRYHCEVNINRDEVLITDLKSANGVYVGINKIPRNIPYVVQHLDIIGFGWTTGAKLVEIDEDEKFVFKLTKITDTPTLCSKLKFQTENDIFNDVEDKMTLLHRSNLETNNIQFSKHVSCQQIKKEITDQGNCNPIITIDDDIVDILSDSDKEEQSAGQTVVPMKKLKLEKNIELKQPAKQDDDVLNVLSDSDIEEQIANQPEVPFKKIKLEKYIELNQPVKQNDDILYVLSDSDKEKQNAHLPEVPFKKIKLEKNIELNQPVKQNDDILYVLSDSDKDIDSYTKINDKDKAKNQTEVDVKKIKIESNVEQNPPIQQDQIKQVNSNIEYEAFDVKQEYLAYDDEPIQIDSDSDTESDNWILRLSQNSPGKPFTKISQENRFSNVKQENSSYSQLDDYSDYEKINNHDNEVETVDGLSIIPPPPLSKEAINLKEAMHITESIASKLVKDTFKHLTNDSISLNKSDPKQCIEPIHCNSQFDGFNTEKIINKVDKASTELTSETKKRIQLIDPPAQLQRVKSCRIGKTETKSKSSLSKRSKIQKETQAKKLISSFEKESRKKKLKEIADKEKLNENNLSKNCSNSSNKTISNVKITPLNRGAFLSNVIHIVKPTKRKQDAQEIQKNKSNEDKLPIIINDHENLNNNKVQTAYPKEKDKSEKYGRIITKSVTKSNGLDNLNAQDSKVPLKNVKPIADTNDLNQNENTILGKPYSKVVPLPPDKPKKKVRFSGLPPQVHVFQIEPGNKLNKTSMAKAYIENQLSRFSLEKLTLMKILRWNPHWLEEQINKSDPPPILGSNVSPTAKLHIYEDHNYYQLCFGDLLLIEIWECLTVAYMKTRYQNNTIQLRIESLPPVPPPEHCFDLFNISVNMSSPSSDTRSVPRVGDIILVTFGHESERNQRFFYVNNVRCLPSPPTNKNSFYSISLQATFTEKMQSLRTGEVIIGKNLVYIKKELMLFEAMEYLNGSPLSNIILSPKPAHFPKINKKPLLKNNLQWTVMLNSSQKIAVNASVSAALNDEPSINMVQGPPGTGKSSVICAIVMSYFYDVQNKRQQNRGKLLICATSNAAVDELVIRLLNIRQNLPRGERFRMVRVGRAEAMHPRALDVSSHQLALRDARSQIQSQVHRPVLSEEISHLEAKMNMWKAAAQDAKDPVRVAYCQTRVTQIINRIALVRGNLEGNVGSGSAIRPDQLPQNERRIIEGADIIVTTLASAHNYKMRGLKDRIALCIIDEAGQAIEPETLIPLTLGVKRLTLIGDPQQLPGYICSQRAKKHGLGESLFSRLTSCMETWTVDIPVVLLQQQYRMHEEIADYPNRAFYDSKIQTVAAARPKLNIPPYLVISISSGDKGQGSCGANEIEAWGVARLVLAVNELVNILKLSLAVITPYNAHKELIKKNLRILDPRLVTVEVNTVDSFQGQERDVVVVSLARSQGVGFLTDMGRMNVMLTRARHALLICLNPTAMLRNHQWRTLIEDAHRRNVYRVLPTSICQPITNRPITDDILKYLQNQ